MTRQAKHQPNCQCCGEPAQLLWKQHPQRSDTWAWATCDICIASVCEECAEVDDSDGSTICADCAATPRAANGN